jgi:glycosyltransferase involved in cell wall biosynthesis
LNSVLIIARYFGTRIPGLIKYLPEFGWRPVLLTTALPQDVHLHYDVSVVETGSRIESRFAPASGSSIFDCILACGGEIINYPDAYKAWKKPAIEAGDDILENEKIDAVISSSSPVTGHLIARELKRKHRIPWLADLRDLWSQNHNYYYSSLRKIFDKRLELKTLSEADALVTVSQPWADRLGTLHEGKTIHAITNGFDPENAGMSPARLTSKFTITYTGTIYSRKQSPAGLLDSLRGLISEGVMEPDDIEVRFYGAGLPWLDKEISRYGLSGVVKQYGTVPQPVAIEKQRESQLLWLMDWDDSAENGWYPMKAFEYMGAGRPILATGGVAGNVIDRLLEETKAGVHAVTTESIRDSLRDLYREYRQKGEIPYHGLETEINKYTHRKMTGEFVAILDGLLERSRETESPL